MKLAWIPIILCTGPGRAQGQMIVRAEDFATPATGLSRPEAGNAVREARYYRHELERFVFGYGELLLDDVDNGNVKKVPAAGESNTPSTSIKKQASRESTKKILLRREPVIEFLRWSAKKHSMS